MKRLFMAIGLLLSVAAPASAQEVDLSRCIGTFNGVLAASGSDPSMYARSYEITTAKHFDAHGYDPDETRLLGIFHLFNGQALPAYCSLYSGGNTDVILYDEAGSAPTFSYSPDRGWSFDPNSRYYGEGWYQRFEQ